MAGNDYLQKLEPRHYQAIRSRIEGRTNREIAQELQVRVQTVERWFSSPVVKDALQEQLARINEIFASRMATIGVRALDKLLEMVEEPHQGDITPSMKLEILSMALQYSIPRQPDNGNGSGPAVGVNINNFGSLTDEQLIARAKQLSAQVIEGTVADDN